MNKKDLFTSYISPIFESHKTHITSMKWFPKGVGYLKYNLVNVTTNECNLLATLGEDGQVLIWDIKDKITKEENNYMKPVIRIEVTKMDCKNKI